MSSDENQKNGGDDQTKTVGPPKSTAREYFESFVVTLIMAIFGMTFILQAVTVPTGSMQNTILVGDYLLVNKFIFTPGEVRCRFSLSVRSSAATSSFLNT